MNKSELVDAIAQQTSLTKKDIDTVVSTFTETVMDAIASGEKVTLVGFGTFEARGREEQPS